jgi:hypothetical protein
MTRCTFSSVNIELATVFAHFTLRISVISYGRPSGVDGFLQYISNRFMESSCSHRVYIASGGARVYAGKEESLGSVDVPYACDLALI